MNLLPFFSIETWILLLIFVALLIAYGTWPFGLFKKLGIPGPRPLPFFGTCLEYRKGFLEFDTECFKKYGKIWGIYDGRQPAVVVMDPQIIKTVLVKECYSTFTNRRRVDLAGELRNAVSLAEDDQWKRLRTVLSPTFTSGKLKEMFPTMKHFGEMLVKNVQKRVEKDSSVPVKDFFGSYSMDVVTSTSFGVNIDSMNNPKSPFVREMQKLTKFDFFDPLFILAFVCPFLTPLMAKMNVSFFPSDAVDFFLRSIDKIKKDREKETHKGRVDFLQMMIESQKSDSDGKNSHKALSDIEVLSQAFIFIFAGYEPTSNTLCYLAYLLALHPDVQQKVVNEIDTILPNKAPLTYEAIMQLDYLDMAVNETLRLYPLGGRIERTCKKDVEINGVTIPKETIVVIPPYTLHRNSEYWPNPEEFRPERFSKENKDNIDPYTYLPFGAGPRNCIGMRFALLTLKVAITSILQHFTFQVCKETQIPLKLLSMGLMTPEKPIILKLVPRTNNAKA
ncbi:cytochrome P450 3A37 [Meleagris gallopavo]|uniref:Cytochrome P450 3A n=1 Tax=Meleagris gallopavo TaxID=9103 RepID=Q1PCR1_MELGA|nr:cytochrome P450 3A37 [Meleagris gallopavo]ABE28024.1 cytochrome P450 3A37 [Meleagris gallopavo]